MKKNQGFISFPVLVAIVISSIILASTYKTAYSSIKYIDNFDFNLIDITHECNQTITYDDGSLSYEYTTTCHNETLYSVDYDKMTNYYRAYGIEINTVLLSKEYVIDINYNYIRWGNNDIKKVPITSYQILEYDLMTVNDSISINKKRLLYG